MKSQGSRYNKIIGFAICVILFATSFATAYPTKPDVPSKKTPFSLRDIPVNIIGPKIDSDTSSVFEFRFTTPLLKQQEQKNPEGTVFLLYSFEDCQFLSEPGKPMLPFTTSYIHIPINAQNVQINILSGSYHEEHLKSPIYPAEKQSIRDDGDTGMSYAYSEYYYDEDFYTKSENLYPINQVEIAEMGNIRGYRYIAVNMYPLRYQPNDSILRITEEMSLQVTWDGEETLSPQYLPKFFQNIISELQMLNSDELEQIDEGIRDGQVEYPTDLANTSNQADYLIITADEFYNSPSLENIANHRATFSGLNVAVVKTSDIYAAVGETIPINVTLDDSGDGSEGDLDLWIKTFVKYVYDYWDGGAQRLQYVLLVGDAYPSTATFYLPFHKTIHHLGGILTVTDYWYSCINDDNENEAIDDFDSVADLIIGRFSVQTELELATVVNKTISYELSPPVYPEQEWGTKILLTHSTGNPAISNPQREIRDSYLLPNQREVSEVYAEEYPNSQRTIAAMKSKINEGHGLFAHIGHGGAVDWQIDNGTLDSRFTTYDVADLNNEERLPLILSMSCWTGMFDYTGRQCLAEVFVNSQAKGSVAFLGASRRSYEVQNLIFYEYLINAIVEEEQDILGASIVEAKLESTSMFDNRFLYNLLGDPALNMSGIHAKSIKPEVRCSIDNCTLDSGVIGLNITVENVGLSNAEQVVVELFINHPFGGGIPVEEVTQTIDVSAETSVTGRIFFPLNEEWDEVFFYLIIDRCDQIDELCESNNINAFVFSFLRADAHGPYICGANTVVHFTGSVTCCFPSYNFPPFNWTWEFGDGNISYDQNPDHIYAQTGRYSVVLTVKDSRNHSNHTSTRATILVNNFVAYAHGPYSGSPQEPVLFWGSASGGLGPYTYYWEFGDGCNGTGAFIYHVYNHSGTYVVNLTATDYHGLVAMSSTMAIIQYHPSIVWVDDDFNENTSGFGEDHFCRISDGMENVSRNGTVYVFSGTYHESLVIDKPMVLSGENPSTTIIENYDYFALYCLAENITVRGFTIQMNGEGSMAIMVNGYYGLPNVVIRDNIIEMNNLGVAGIYLMGTTNVTVSNNSIRNSTWVGILLETISNSTIINNTITQNPVGLLLYFSLNNTISENIIADNEHGISIDFVEGKSARFLVKRNSSYSCDNTIYHNIFIDNTFQAVDVGQNNKWNLNIPEGGNYWSNYQGVDTNGDGMGEEPYIIDDDSSDDQPWLHQHGWSPPATPSNPFPPNFGQNINVYTSLSWTGSDSTPGETVIYHVYLGIKPSELRLVANTTCLIYNPGHLQGNTKYFWKIIAEDELHHTTEGPLWCFKTAFLLEPYNLQTG